MSPTDLEPLGIFDAALDAIIIMDASGAVKAWNASAERTFGYTRAEAIGRSVAQLLIPPAQRKAHYDGIERYLRTGEAPLLGRHIELRALHRQGHEIPVELTITSLSRDGGPVFYAFLRDITERVEAREAQRQSERDFQLLVQGVTDYAICMLDREGCVRSWNTGAQKLKGYAAAEIIGAHVSTFYTDEDREAGAPKKALDTAEREGRFETESWRVRKDGSKFLANVVIDAIRDDAGALVGFVKVTRDITERYLTEETRRAAEHASEAKTQFLASMSHEIRTPLNGIIGYTDLLLDQDLKPEQRQLLERIQFCGAALLTVVNDILDFSKIEAGQIALHPQPFSIQALVHDTVSIVAEVAQRKGLAMDVDLDPDLPKALVGDEARLRQILLNLLNNAAKFTQQGSVSLHVKCHGPSSECERIRFSVKDTGIGIPQDQRKYLFHRFHQVNRSNTREFGGTGLGLAISKRLVQLMGGEIGLESEEGKGSTFWFSVPLPRADDSTITQPQFVATVAQVSASGRILLVEDLEHNRDLARVILTNAGHEVDTAENGAEAVAAVQTKTYDLVLMDVQMPVMDGLTATERIRELGSLASNIPIIAMTANVLPKQVKAFGEIGVNDHVGKPFKKTELLKKVNTWLGRAVSSPSPTLHDTAALHELRQLMGPEWVASGLTRLREQIDQAFGSESEALRDRDQLARRAHILVSHSALFGFGELSRLCSELEEACASGQDVSSPYRKAKAAAHSADVRASEMLSQTIVMEGGSRTP